MPLAMAILTQIWEYLPARFKPFALRLSHSQSYEKQLIIRFLRVDAASKWGREVAGILTQSS
jgi:hypothetical protein